MATWNQIIQSIEDDVQDANVYFDTNNDLIPFLQNAYNIIVAETQCLVKKVNLPFLANIIYYNFLDPTNYPTINVTDFMAVTAIFSNQTNLWLLDDKTLRDFSKDRIDFENWTGNAIWWAPTGDYRIAAIVPYQTQASSTFDLYYWAQAPTIPVDHTTSPLIPTDFHYLLELYVNAKFLEIAKEFKKASYLWEEFWGVSPETGEETTGINRLAERCKNIAKADLLMLG